ncbi:transcription initiation factor TFIID subunit 7-like isoform X2 [Anthonomus grandis grandis]|uniref:transcription initiation factor TFIID subunit 7-like isoform X2 n=1 Tax=Anthonomus grandis grandis TaxID=2921223 RepID=UPI0021660EAB|nr:transcription initiation factor TFIID subunit 7-like isoform X2 [Anthonomus grandis grandis]
MTDVTEPEFELEEQFILRLPLDEAAKVRETLRTKPEKLKKNLKIKLDTSLDIGTVTIGKKKLYAYLRKFPTIIESYKTNLGNDTATIFKTADVSHMLECFHEPLPHFKKESPHGYTPPLKNVKHRRFRKTLVNPEVAEETELVTKELYYLLSTDMEAVSTRFEVHYEEQDGGDSARNQTDCNEQLILNPSIQENMLFGHLSSSETDSEIDVIE